MSEKVFKFLLSELKTVRLICPRDACATVTEVSVERMDAVGRKGACPVCGHDLYPGGWGHPAPNPLSQLSDAIVAAQRAMAKAGAVQVEFVLTDAE